MASPDAFVIIHNMMYRIVRGLEIGILLLISAAIFTYSNPPLTDQIEKVRAHTRDLEFNYITWTANATLLKIRAASIGLPHTLDREAQKQAVMEYLRATQSVLEKEYALKQVYSDAAITDKEAASMALRAELNTLYERQHELAPLAEAVLQEQISQILAELNLSVFNQPVPNVLYHATPLPYALIVSPRDRIEQVANISIHTEITIDQQATLETAVDENLNTSSLVVPIGGVGVYPTMVMRSTDLSWILNTIAHEWTHNYLTLRPLGFLYTKTPELRTINETTASIAGDEIGMLALERFYPELVTASHPTVGLISAPLDHPEPGDFLRPPFDYRAEMNETRTTVDALLKDGKIEEAEAYMEARRLVFLKNGYLLRKINQAFFAFFGAYADSPGGAAGEDPVGPAVRELRAQSDSLADFINTISWVNDFSDLQKLVDE